MRHILLIRSGVTEYDQQGRIQGTLDIPLSEDGRRQVDVLIEELGSQRLAAIYSSPCRSAKDTAEALGQALDMKPKTIDKLHNLDLGLWQGMLVDDVKIKQPKVYRQWQEQPETVCPPQGETVVKAKARVAEALAKLIKKHKGDDEVAIVVPEPLASVVRHVLRHDNLANLWQASSVGPTARWEHIELQPQLAGVK